MSYWRVRFFTASADDPRPVTFPPPGPYWVSGYSGGKSGELAEAVLIAYLPRKSDLKKLWPGAKAAEWSNKKGQIEFTSRFPKPKWWKASAGEDPKL